ncbi:V-type ATP synthase subunit F [Candidatus Micrarchaeota archaeon]|nr:V-type ATP synthase subunit F [Candidatus Micrarchaeota archaeon]MBU1682224.1 V-type ATP synthase subunit F [Candidatus Micrarchaeota archaeon]
MKSKIVVLGDAPLVMGFKLAGIENAINANPATFQNELEKALANEEYGIIITNEKLLENIDWRLKKKLDSIAYPVVVPLPDQSGGSKEGDEIRGLIKRALGFDLGKK